MLKFEFYNKEELKAFIRLVQEIIMELEAENMNCNDNFLRFEVQAKIELMEELLPKIEKKQFNAQQKNSVHLSKAVSLILFQYRAIAVDIYAEMLKSRLVQEIHREMI